MRYAAKTLGPEAGGRRWVYESWLADGENESMDVAGKKDDRGAVC